MVPVPPLPDAASSGSSGKNCNKSADLLEPDHKGKTGDSVASLCKGGQCSTVLMHVCETNTSNETTRINAQSFSMRLMVEAAVAWDDPLQSQGSLLVVAGLIMSYDD
eukprot:5214449-Amphidinium_carterae.1